MSEHKACNRAVCMLAGRHVGECEYAVQSPATPQEPSGAQLALADIERAYSETEVALAQVVSRNDKELFFNGDKALRAHLQKNLDYYRIRRDGVRALLASAPPAATPGGTKP